MINRHLDIMKRIDNALSDVYLQADTNAYEFDLFFDIGEMTKIAEFLEGFDIEIQNDADDDTTGPNSF